MLALALGVLAGCTEQRDARVVESGSPLCVQGASASLDALYASHFAASASTGCASSGCHGTGAGGLTFTNAQQFWAATVNDGARQWVVPGAPEQSLLYTKLLPDAANRMPEGGPYLDDAALAQVAAWICAGAPAPSDAGVPEPVPGGPALSGLTPDSVAVGSADVSVQLEGARFESGSRVELGGAPLPTRFVSASRLTATVSAAINAQAAEHRVRVVNPPDGGISEERVFRVLNPTPTLTALAPDTVATGGAAFDVSLAGSNFTASSVVLLDGAEVATTWVSGTSLRARMPTFPAPGSHQVAVRNPAPGGGTSAARTLTAALIDGPTITGLSPSPGEADRAFRLGVTGSGYDCTPTRASVLFDGSALTPATCAATRLEVDVPATAAGDHGVQVRNADGKLSATVTLSLLAPNPVPALASLTPSEASQGGTALTLNVTGSGFVSGTSLRFNGVARPTSVQGASALSANLTSADLAVAGDFPVTVVSPAPGGGTSNALAFAVVRPNPVPRPTSLSPCGLVAGGAGFTLTLDGQDFASGASVTFNGTAVSVSTRSATRLTVTVPASLVATAPASGAASVVVTNPAPGGGASAPAWFGLATRAVTLATHVQPLFEKNCNSGCHSSPSTPINLTSGRAYGELVGQTSSGCASTLLVKACGPLRSQSVLIDKVLATNSSPACSGAAMPKGQPLTAAEKQTLIDWVAQGAPP
ncbi:IPT/TIG domain-containing protein [Pyxidicoccus caerfyrddinensis]|uniref:IPT/TIG domain-containing protein n=1 Tax=Pyxidicoccus caerfyrddinensis TaxID=2709663 RepID=UPI0013DCC89D|nr:IPT/TIG domain-containing protein [Pyxidicoccus caerfyrddinensis]